MPHSPAKPPASGPRNHSRNGYLLLGLLLALTVFGLQSSITVMQQDTKLKRFGENDLRSNLNNLRRAIDLFKYNHLPTSPEFATLSYYLNNGPVEKVFDVLASYSYMRARLASGSMRWRLVTNLVGNSSFEDDSGTTAPLVGTWRGNFTPNDGVPNGWELINNGVQQYVGLAAGTHVLSFWARAQTGSAEIKVKVWPSPETTPLIELTSNKTTWKRLSGAFNNPVGQIVRLEILQNSATSGDEVFVDGVMLEKWTLPPGAPATMSPVPSAWTEDFNVVSNLASYSLQTQFMQDLVGTDTTPASLSWWLEW